MAGTAGFGSALAIRAKEARQRAQTADMLGLTTALPTGQGSEMRSIQPSFVQSAQPVMPPKADPPLEERMYGEAERFLMGLQPKPQQ